MEVTPSGVSVPRAPAAPGAHHPVAHPAPPHVPTARQSQQLRLTLRADFPHDAWWTQATVEFDDGSREVLELKKSAAPQCFAIAPRTVKSLKLFELIKAEDPSPFPALTQIEAWGVEA